jgi:transposase
MGEVVRYTYRLRPGRTAEGALPAEWGRCRWLWNEAVHQQKSGTKLTVVKLGKLLTEARGRLPWLREGSQVAQQQCLRTYMQSLDRSFTVKGCRKPKTRAKRQAAKLHKKALRQTRHDTRAWAERVVAAHCLIAVEDFKPAFLTKSTLARKSADAAIGAAKRELIERATRAGRKVVMVRPAHTTTACSKCFARSKRLELHERTFRCDSCHFTDCRDRNAARVILATAERGRNSIDEVRQADRPPSGLGVVAF